MIGNRYDLFSTPNALAIMMCYALPGAAIILFLNTALMTAVVGIFVLLSLLTHLHLYAQKCERKFWGNIDEPIFVFDWGKDGKKFVEKMPPDLRKNLVAGPANKLQEIKEEVENKLKESGNLFFANPGRQLPVLMRYFRDGDRAMETQKKYRADCIKMMIEELGTWQKAWNKADRQDYLETFIFTGRNGSVI